MIDQKPNVSVALGKDLLIERNYFLELLQLFLRELFGKIDAFRL